MCRLVAGYAWSREGAGLLGRLAVLVAEAASSDPYLREVTGSVDKHCHGYGLVLVYRGSGSRAWRVLYERFDALEEGVDEEEACRANLEATRGAAERLRGLLSAAEEAYLVFHARRAGRSEPRGSLNTHPYSVTAATPDGAVVLYLAHNGGLRKAELAEALGLDPEDYTDSHLLAIWAARRLERGEAGEPWEPLAEGYGFAKSGYDVALLALEDTMRGVEPDLYIAAGMAPGLDEARRRYYEPIGFRGNGAAGYISSTVRDLARREGLDIETWSLRWGVYGVEPGGLRLLRELGAGQSG